VGEIKKIQSMFSSNQLSCSGPWKVGQSYLIRTVTHYYTGKLETVYSQELVLSKAAWIADTGRYYDALKKGTFNEVEPIIGDCIINRGAIIDAVEWKWDLPEVQK
jgi:hypothetical protein